MGEASGFVIGGRGWLQRLKTRLGFPDAQTIHEAIEETLKDDTASDTPLPPRQRDMLLRTLRFGELRVDDVMVPRADIIAVEDDATIGALLDVFRRAGHSRLPVYHETLDDLRGMVHIKDLVSWMIEQSAGLSASDEPKIGTPGPGHDPAKAINLSSFDLGVTVASTKIKRPVLYVPPSMPALNLLMRMQSTRVHLAMVVDEYGGTDGLVSIEDLVEQIVGDIEDEHDELEAALVIEDQKGGLIASARVTIGELEQRLGIPLNDPEEDDFETLGGLIFARLGRVPVRGELVPHPGGIEFEVLDADPRRVTRVRILVDQPRKPTDTDAARADSEQG